MSARILVVEDDPDLRGVMVDALTADGHDTDAVGDGVAALERLAESPPDLLVLDVGLGAAPDGVEVCRRLRRADRDVYVMAVTARDAEADVVLALEAGADDYVVKPVGISELRSRVRAALRRTRPTSVAAETLASGPLRVDVAARAAYAGDVALALTPSELTILEILLRSAGRVLSREALVSALFRDSAYRNPRAIDVHVHHLREKISAAGGGDGAIVTVRGAGYRLAR